MKRGIASHSPSDDAFTIITGYRLDGGTVTPLDINLQSMTWEGRPAPELLATLDNAHQELGPGRVSRR